MNDKINIALKYYTIKQKEILNIVNFSSELNTEDIIHYGEELNIIENKMTALEVAKEN
ncbi:MAG: hypothetical protein HKP48_03740 [Winogradskyella sp.]|uniref:hypothetical protein n=1 Tax=Winogradskyella sp. TaxID=1883156 RepID=UPI00179114AA|nr:hypothetical protein [Winogradskyella sp.]MBT8245801.1 hypothetical protein [Winogradskyella sp.]NNK22414.1 hypothetical protein [Winogradskyella sp.]